MGLKSLMCAAALVLAIVGAPAAAASKPPNILLILTDNTGWADWGAYGGGALRGTPSPHIDRLANEGVRLLNFNTEAQCTPSRSALMTGRYAVRSGTQSVPVGTSHYGLTPWEVTIAQSLREAGYATAIFGKWHLGQTPGRFPTDKGFDEWYGIANSSNDALNNDKAWMAATSIAADAQMVPEHEVAHVLEARRGEIPTKVRLFDTEARRRIDGELTTRAIGFIKAQAKAGKPFFAYVPMTATHYPTLPHPDFAGKSGHGDYADMLVQTDHYVGQMLKALDEAGVAKDTLVIFTADNGVESPRNGDGAYTGWSGPWAGSYFTAMEGGLRVPFLMRWPGKVPAGVVSNEIVHLVDVFPTLAGIAGAAVPKDRPIDGLDMGAFFTGQRKASGRAGFPVYVGDDLRALKWHDWKIHFAWATDKFDAVVRYSTIPRVANLAADPREERNVAEPSNTWLQYTALPFLYRFIGSVKEFPNVPVGAQDSYQPAKAHGASK